MIVEDRRYLRLPLAEPCSSPAAPAADNPLANRAVQCAPDRPPQAAGGAGEAGRPRLLPTSRRKLFQPSPGQERSANLGRRHVGEFRLHRPGASGELERFGGRLPRLGLQDVRWKTLDCFERICQRLHGWREIAAIPDPDRARKRVRRVRRAAWRGDPVVASLQNIASGPVHHVAP